MHRHLLTMFLLPALASVALATETENLGIAVLPAPGKVVVDGKSDDWDLSGGVFICGDVENQRDKFAVWFHAMYDAENLYLLARWIDETPLNNPGQWPGRTGSRATASSSASSPRPTRRRSSATTSPAGAIATARTSSSSRSARTSTAAPSRMPRRGAQAGLHEERRRQRLRPGDRPALETAQQGRAGAEGGGNDRRHRRAELHHRPVGRMSLKDIFKPGVTPDRVFTFMASNCWGPATLEAQGQGRAAAGATGRRPRVPRPHGERRCRWSTGRAWSSRRSSRLQGDRVHHARGRLRLAAHPQRRGPGRAPTLERRRS